MIILLIFNLVFLLVNILLIISTFKVYFDSYFERCFYVQSMIILENLGFQEYVFQHFNTLTFEEINLDYDLFRYAKNHNEDEFISYFKAKKEELTKTKLEKIFTRGK